MKPFLGIDLTLDLKNEQFNGHEFLVQTPSLALSQSSEASTHKVKETGKKFKSSLLLRIVLLPAAYKVSSLLIIPLADRLNLGTLVILVVIGAVYGTIRQKTKAKKSNTDESTQTSESTQTLSHRSGVYDAIYAELAVPDNAKDVDILSFFYKIKYGKMMVHKKSRQFFQFSNSEFKVFTDEENLYLANLKGKYAFPLSSIVKIHTINKRICIARWNKSEKVDEGIYKQYKLTTNDSGCVCCEPYYILEINHQGESYGIFFPAYELPTFEAYMK